jgi:S1-C subfamily serine protease
LDCDSEFVGEKFMEELQDPVQARETLRWSNWIRISRIILKRALPFLAAILFAFLGVYLYNIFFPAPNPLSKNDVDQSIEEAMASATPAPAFSSEVYRIILPSLVFIQIQQESEDDEDGIGVGSGVVVNSNGDILTAFHVVANAVEIEVIFADGSRTEAEIIAAEPEKDIAVLEPKKPPDLIVPAVLGSTRAMRVGDEAFAVGNPLGLVASMSAGVISGFDRSIPFNDDGDQRLEGLIQFDTAVNPGNSGGPLLNRYGQVVGIVTALANPYDQDFFVGIGFAVPIGTAVSAAGGPDY